MICIYKEGNTDCKEGEYEVVLQADTTPDTFPTDGATVTRLDRTGYLGPEVKFAPGSLLHCVDTGKNYYLSEDATQWNEDGGGE